MSDIIGTNSSLAIKMKDELQRRRNGKGAGTSAAVVLGGKLIAGCAVGLCGEQGVPAETSDLYDIGSVTKVYCAAAVQKLVSAGLVDLDAPVTRYLPNFHLRDSREGEITVRMTLNHTSGLPGTNPRNMITTGAPGIDRESSNMKYWSRAKLKANPGEISSYCNEGFEIATSIVEAVSGKSFIDYLQEVILEPIGIHSAEFADHPAVNGRAMRSLGCKEEYLIAAGAGALRCTIADNAMFGYAFLHPGVFTAEELKSILEPQGVTFLKKDEMSPPYGLGWDMVDLSKAPLDLGPGACCKGGATIHFTSYLIISPKYDLSVSLSATYDCGFQTGDEIYAIIDVISKELGLNIQSRTFAPKLPAMPISETWKERYCGIYYSSYGIYRLDAVGSNLLFKQYTGDEWVSVPEIPEAIFNGNIFTIGKEHIDFEEANNCAYVLMTDSSMGVPLYPFGQKPFGVFHMNPCWQARLGKTYVTCNLHFIDLELDGPAIARIQTLEKGILCFFATNKSPISVISCGDDDTDMYFNAPGWGAINRWAPYIDRSDGRELLILWDYDYIDADTLCLLGERNVCVSSGKNDVFLTEVGMEISSPIPEGVWLAILDTEGNLVSKYGSGDKIPVLQKGYALFISEATMEFFVSVRER